MDKNNNLKFWKSVETTDPKFTKKVSYGKRKYTSIDATYQIKKATSTWGQYGAKWGVKGCKYDYIRNHKNEIVELILDAVFFWPGGSFEMSTDIKYAIGGDCRKKILTDLTTKSLSKLGFNTDVFLGLHDDNKYTNLAAADTEKKGLKEISESIKMLTDFPKVMDVWNGLDIVQKNDPKIKALFAEKKQDLADETAPITT